MHSNVNCIVFGVSSSSCCCSPSFFLLLRDLILISATREHSGPSWTRFLALALSETVLGTRKKFSPRAPEDTFGIFYDPMCNGRTYMALIQQVCRKKRKQRRPSAQYSLSFTTLQQLKSHLHVHPARNFVFYDYSYVKFNPIMIFSSFDVCRYVNFFCIFLG